MSTMSLPDFPPPGYEEFRELVISGNVEAVKRALEDPNIQNMAGAEYFQVDETRTIHHPFCYAAIASKSFEMVKLIFSYAEFDPEDDRLHWLAIETEDIPMIEFVLSVVPTVEAWETLESAIDTGNAKVIRIVNKYMNRWNDFSQC